jgi:hypothetical protein
VTVLRTPVYENYTYHIEREFGLYNPRQYGHLKGEREEMILFVTDEGVCIYNYDFEIVRLISQTFDGAVQVFMGEMMPEGPYRYCGEVYNITSKDTFLHLREFASYSKQYPESNNEQEVCQS